jgi:hypothetical protein
MVAFENNGMTLKIYCLKKFCEPIMRNRGVRMEAGGTLMELLG